MKTLQQFITEALMNREGLISEDLPADSSNFKYPPPFLTMKRRAVRAFPDGQHVATYYISQLKKFISIPFDSNKNTDPLPTVGESTNQDHADDARDWAVHHNDEMKKQEAMGHQELAYHHRLERDKWASRVPGGLKETFTPPVDRAWERGLGKEREPANDPKPLHLPHITPKHHPKDFNARNMDLLTSKGRVGARHQDNKAIKEEVITEAAKPKKKAKVKPKPYDFFKHLKDIAKGGEDKFKPLRFNSGERLKMQPEMAQLILHAHSKLNPMNQAKAHAALRKGKKTFSRFHTFALGVATVTK